MSTEVAETILEQLGGNRFVVMTGARSEVAAVTHVYADQLCDVFRSETGLDTTL